MRATVRFNDQSKEFTSRVAVFTDAMMGLMAAGVENQIKTSGKTPFDKGGLRGSVRHVKKGVASYEVTADKVYAAYQEFGQRADGSHKVKNYTTSGTGPGWFRDAVDNVKGRAQEYTRAALQAAGLGGL